MIALIKLKLRGHMVCLSSCMGGRKPLKAGPTSPLLA